MAYGSTTTPGSASSFTSKPGLDEQILSQFFSGALGLQQPKSPLAGVLRDYGSGKIPPNILANFRNELDRSNAGITESFGKVGARFGTDLADTLSRNAGQATTGLFAGAEDRALDAIRTALGVGTTTAGLQFQRSEGGLDRLIQDLAQRRQLEGLGMQLDAASQNSLMDFIIRLLLGGG